MNPDYSIPTISEELISHVRKQVAEWNEELLDPWIPSPAALSLAQTVRNSCPRMAAALEQAEILQPWAEMLDDQIRKLMRELRDMGAVQTANEAYSQAQMALVPWSWEIQEEWLQAHCIDYEPEPDPDLYVDTDEEFEQDGIPLLRFQPGQAGLVKKMLSNAVNSALKNRNLTSQQVMGLGAFLWLVERLPENHGRYSGKIELAYDYGDGKGWMMVKISQEGLVLDKGEVIRSEFGGDHPSKTVFQASSYCTPDYDLDFDLEEWLRDFASDAGDTEVEFSIDWHPVDKMPTWEAFPDF